MQTRVRRLLQIPRETSITTTWPVFFAENNFFDYVTLMRSPPSINPPPRFYSSFDNRERLTHAVSEFHNRRSRNTHQILIFYIYKLRKNKEEAKIYRRFEMERTDHQRIALKHPVGKAERSSDYPDEERKGTNFQDHRRTSAKRVEDVSISHSILSSCCFPCNFAASTVRVHAAK